MRLFSLRQLSCLLPLILTVAGCTGVVQNQPVQKSTPKEFSITDHGAVGDGTTLNTAAIQATIAAAAQAGGGVVVVPGGRFLTGSIFLQPGVELHLAEGAVLLGSTNIEDYPKRVTRIEGHFEPWRMALVNAQNLTGVRITGPGILDGNGVPFWQAFWQRRRENPRATNLEVERPRLMFIDSCRDVHIDGVQLQDSGFWNLHLYRSRNVTIENVRITIPSSARLNVRGPSTDGIDVDSSQDVVIRHCYISNNDDNIALKGSKGPKADQDKDSPPVENILIEDVECGDGNGLITCGSEATIVRNVVARNCTMSGGATLLTLKLRPDTPQHYENITLENITLKGTGRLINMAPWTQFFDLQGQPAPSRQVKNITLRNIHGTYGSFGTMRGNPGDDIRDFTFENIDVKLNRPGLPTADIHNFIAKNVVVNGTPFVPPAPDSSSAPARP
jgi:alpha-L-rhamnosidase